MVNSTPRPLYPRERDPLPIVQEAGWAPGPVWTAAKNLSPPGFDPRTVQSVASRYTDWAIAAHLKNIFSFSFCLFVISLYRYMFSIFLSHASILSVVIPPARSSPSHSNTSPAPVFPFVYPFGTFLFLPCFSSISSPPARSSVLCLYTSNGRR
jgi:hypothetical protein